MGFRPISGVPRMNINRGGRGTSSRLSADHLNQSALTQVMEAIANAANPSVLTDNGDATFTHVADGVTTIYSINDALGQLDASGVSNVTSAIDFSQLSPAQTTEIITAFDFTQLTAGQVADLNALIDPSSWTPAQIGAMKTQLAFIASDIAATPPSGLTGTDVQALLDELAAMFANLTSADVGYDNAASGLTSGNLQDAVDELAAITSAATVSFVNTGTGENVLAGQVGQDVNFRSIVGLEGVSVVTNGSNLEVRFDPSTLTAAAVSDLVAELGISQSDNGDGTYTLAVNGSSITVDTSAASNPISDTAGYFTATNTEGALQEIGAALAADLDTDPTNELGTLATNSSGVQTYDPDGSGPLSPLPSIDMATQSELDDVANSTGSAQSDIDAHILADLDTDPTNEIELPAGGTVGQVLTTDGAGGVTWQEPAIITPLFYDGTTGDDFSGIDPSSSAINLGAYWDCTISPSQYFVWNPCSGSYTSISGGGSSYSPQALLCNYIYTDAATNTPFGLGDTSVVLGSVTATMSLTTGTVASSLTSDVVKFGVEFKTGAFNLYQSPGGFDINFSAPISGCVTFALWNNIGHNITVVASSNGTIDSYSAVEASSDLDLTAWPSGFRTRSTSSSNEATSVVVAQVTDVDKLTVNSDFSSTTIPGNPPSIMWGASV